MENTNDISSYHFGATDIAKEFNIFLIFIKKHYEKLIINLIFSCIDF